MVEYPDGEAALEVELREALKARPAPPGFAARTLAAAAHRPAAPRGTLSGLSRRQGPLVRWSAAAALLLCLCSGAWLEHRRQEQIAGEQARQQVLLALRIAGNTLQAVQHRVVEDDHHSQEESQ